jgi:hypothetical protein
MGHRIGDQIDRRRFVYHSAAHNIGIPNASIAAPVTLVRVKV